MNYLPSGSYNNSSCITLDNLSSGYIRVYEQTPTSNSNINYVDYFVNYNYLSRSGTQSFGNWTTNVNCVDKTQFTDDFYYRIDFTNILIMFTIMVFFIIFIPFKIFTKLFKRGGI